MSPAKDKTKISLRVVPGAAKSELAGLTSGVLRIKIAAPPLKGKANKELISFLSRLLGIPKGALTIIKGHTSRDKVIAIDDLSQDEVTRRLSSSADADTSRLPHQ